MVTLLQTLLRRFGLLGAILRLTAGVAWGLATLLVLPVIVVEGRSAVEAVQESAVLVRSQLGLPVRTKIRLYLPWLLAAMVGTLLTVGGIVAFLHYRQASPEWAAAGVLLAVVGGLLTFGSVSVQAAADALLNTLLYRHARRLPIPDVDHRDLPPLLSP